jgi:hypothetical protein
MSFLTLVVARRQEPAFSRFFLFTSLVLLGGELQKIDILTPNSCEYITSVLINVGQLLENRRRRTV